MTLKVSTATGTVCTVARLPQPDVFIVRKICETCVEYFCWLFTTVAVYIHGRVSPCTPCYTCVNCSFQEQRFANIVCMELCHL